MNRKKKFAEPKNNCSKMVVFTQLRILHHIVLTYTRQDF